MKVNKNAGRPLGSKRKSRIFNEVEFRQVIKSITNSRLSSNIERNITLIYFNYYLGLKGIELCRLKLDDVYDGKKILNGIRIIKPKHRIVALNNPQLKGALDSYIKSRVEKESASFSIHSDLFKSQKGSYSPQSLNRLINTIYKDAGLSCVTSHSGKLSFMHHKFNHGFSLEQVHDLTGNVHINTTRVLLVGLGG